MRVGQARCARRIIVRVQRAAGSIGRPLKLDVGPQGQLCSVVDTVGSMGGNVWIRGMSLLLRHSLGCPFPCLGS